MPLQILIAENDPNTRKTISEFLENEKFETISAKTRDEAKLVVDTNPLLGAIVIDRRLTNDKDEKDQSGWELALEARETGAARAPIIMYSTFESSNMGIPEPSDQLSNEYLPRITHLTKDAGDEALVARILEEIQRNLREVPDLEEIPRYHQPPIIAFAPNNGAAPLAEELRKGGEETEIRSNLAEMETAVNIYPSAMFAVDVTDQVGLDAIEVVNKSRSISDQNFYIAALTSGDEFKNRALQAGVNAFVIRQSPQTDALELIMRMSEYKIELEKIAAQKPQTQLALRQYDELVTQLSNAKHSPKHDITAAFHTVQRALDWPLLMPKEKAVLTSLYLRMLAACESGLDTETLDICMEGASMLATDRARTGNVQDWVERAERHSADFTITWLDDDALSGDRDDSDD